MSEHLVRVHIRLMGQMPTDNEVEFVSKLSKELEQSIASAAVGELDGVEFGEGESTIWLYGKDAAKMVEVVKSHLKNRSLPKGSHLFVRYGSVRDAQAKQERIVLGR